MEKITKKQLKTIWALAHRAGLKEEELHILMKSVFGKSSVRSLTKHEAGRVVEHLLHKGEEKYTISKRMMDRKEGTTTAQVAFIERLTVQMGWSQNYLRGLARRMYGVRQLKDLNVRQASGLIEALKAIKFRHVLDRAKPVKGHAA